MYIVSCTINANGSTTYHEFECESIKIAKSKIAYLLSLDSTSNISVRPVIKTV